MRPRLSPYLARFIILKIDQTGRPLSLNIAILRKLLSLCLDTQVVASSDSLLKSYMIPRPHLVLFLNETGVCAYELPLFVW